MPEDPINRLISGLGNVSGNHNSIAIHLAGASEITQMIAQVKRLESQVAEMQKKMYVMSDLLNRQSQMKRKIRQSKRRQAPKKFTQMGLF